MAAWRTGLEGRHDVAVVEVPLLFEAGIEGAFDATVAVLADEALREERAAARGHEGVEGRTGRQLSQDEKADRADHVIRNDGTISDLEAAVGDVLAELRGKVEVDEGSGRVASSTPAARGRVHPATRRRAGRRRAPSSSACSAPC